MRHLGLLISIIFLFNFHGYTQKVREDNRPQKRIENSYNRYQASEVNKLDLLQALDFAGIGIHKFDIGNFKKKYKLLIYIKEYKNQELVGTDTIIEGNNEYHYYKPGKKNYFIDFIDQIKVFTKEADEKLKLRVGTYKRITTEEIEYEKSMENQFYSIRRYVNSLWEKGEEKPLMVYASSWYNERIDAQRFCGVINLSENDKRTEELLSSSPHYFKLCYKVSELND